MRTLRIGPLVAAALLALSPSAPAVAAPPEGTVHALGGPTAIADSYIVVLKDSLKDSSAGEEAVDRTARTLADRHGGRIAQVYRHALSGFEVRLSLRQARRLAADPRVASVTQNHTVSAADIQTPAPSWGLDRIDQRNRPLDNAYAYPNVAPVVRAYVIDSGVRLTHREFTGRIRSGFDARDNDTDATDCYGHGTHVAGTIGGTTYGVAKNVEIVAVRVLDCEGRGTVAHVIGGVDWVTADHDPGEPAVANMSLNTVFSEPLNQAVARSIADGITYAVSAGNDSGADACATSPASVPEAITVAATGADDARTWYSNIGSCVDIFAPGTDITSAHLDSDTATRVASGTSMAAPHVTGAAALILADHPDYTPAQVTAELLADATPGAVVDPGPGTPNRLLYVDRTAPSNDFALTASPATATAPAGATATTTISAAVTAGGAQTVTLTAVGLPSGATATFSPAAIAGTGSSRLTISIGTRTAAGTYSVLVLGTGPDATRAARFTLTVTAVPGCVGVADTDAPLSSGVVNVPITIAGCAGNAARNSTIAVRIEHTAVNDLTLHLFAPDGSMYILMERTGAGTGPDLDYTFTHDLSSEVANGTWTLRVADVGPHGTGFFDSWTLNLAGEDLPIPACGGLATGDVPIPDLAAAESPITVTGCDRAAGQRAYVEVQVIHAATRGLSLSLVAPDGSVYPLLGVGGTLGLPNVFHTFLVNPTGQNANGTWRLRAQDHIAGEWGPAYIDGWKLTL